MYNSVDCQDSNMKWGKVPVKFLKHSVNVSNDSVNFCKACCSLKSSHMYCINFNRKIKFEGNL